MTNRVLLSSSLFSISKPGVDVLAPPAVSYDYLALDSRLEQARPLLIGTALNVALNNQLGSKVYFGTTFGFVPHVSVFAYDAYTDIVTGELYAAVSDYITYKDVGAKSFLRSVFYVRAQEDGFFLLDDFVYTRPFSSFGRIIYFVWAP
jgi:hypothetical protein